jgi:tRNA(Ile)-lysidine synthase
LRAGERSEQRQHRVSLLARCTFPQGDVTCAVSGGADSLALLVLAVHAGCTVTAVHVDHGLREGSADEADVVRDAAARYGAAFRAETVDVSPGPNLEARARAARYAVLPRDVLTGHTADDQAETVLLNLLRGAALDGLAGMRPEGHPILALRRFETEALCAAEGLTPVVDPSNVDPAYRRNRVRHELLPALRSVHPAAEENVRRTAELLREEAAVLDEVVAGVLDGRREIELHRLAALPPALARLVMRRLAEDTLGRTVPRAARRTEDVLALGPDGALDLGDGARARVRAGTLSFERTPAR